MLLRFTKMHGLGNDFMVVDCLTQNIHFSPEKIRQLSNRKRGIGFDQLLLVEAPDNPDADFRYRIYNADGSVAEQCGNGARCFARFVYEKKLCFKKTIRVQVMNKIISLTINDHGHVNVDMGEPVFSPQAVPFRQSEQTDGIYSLTLKERTLDISVLSIGNPHAVICFDNLSSDQPLWQTDLVEIISPEIQQHPDFPEQCNVGFYEIISPDKINLRVYERGVGETMACGSGACAAMAAAFMKKQVGESVQVHLKGGMLTIDWKGPGHSLYMTGPASRVFEGHIKI
ncbi:MAG: diaminopimelate epimerase [Endozoicomonadaceae bacterium]|nr:diaminopimelate epimerase [Endozoicomonadaceae bacterium]MCY4329859.1 diaminopimelate epimerase [Endozoicomonadaceae bacterium]